MPTSSSGIPHAEHTISAATHSACAADYSMFEGWKVRGNAQHVFSRGDLVVDNGKYDRRQPDADDYLRREATPEEPGNAAARDQP